MIAESDRAPLFPEKSTMPVLLFLALAAGAVFLVQAMGRHPESAWQAYLINFLFWSSIAQGGVLFSAVMTLTRARWSSSMSGVAESFSAFFPISFVLFLGLIPGIPYLFPWLAENLHGKEVWLNAPFLLVRDGLGLIVLYAIGLAYVHTTLGEKLYRASGNGGLQRTFFGIRLSKRKSTDGQEQRKTLLSILYILAYCVILSLLGYDLVMSLSPHWYSTLFGGYTFVKAFYAGLGGVIILAAVISIKTKGRASLEKSHFHDIGKLFLGFCLVWADFFYCQFVVIWYGNISEETAYIIERTLLPPYKFLAWFVFGVCFIVPFLVLLNRKVKMMPKVMIVLCGSVLVGLWLEHLLLIGPALSGPGGALPLRLSDGVMFLGFFSLIAIAVIRFVNRFPELVWTAKKAPDAKETR
jgi:hypothetical protein